MMSVCNVHVHYCPVTIAAFSIKYLLFVGHIRQFPPYLLLSIPIADEAA